MSTRTSKAVIQLKELLESGRRDTATKFVQYGGVEALLGEYCSGSSNANSNAFLVLVCFAHMLSYSYTINVQSLEKNTEKSLYVDCVAGAVVE